MINEKSTRLEFLDYLISDEYKFVPLRENDVEVVKEAVTGGELQDVSWDERSFLDLQERANEIGWIEEIRMMDKRTFRLHSEAVTTNTAFHELTIKTLELPELVEDFDGTEIEEIEEAVQTAIIGGNVEVKCTCASFQYWGWAFILDKLDSAWSSGNDPSYYDLAPDIRNKQRKRTLCKHLFRALTDIEDGGELVYEMAVDVGRKIRAGRY